MVRRVDVAQLAGVTPAVVSYVTNNSHPVSPETRAKVVAAIQELGYRPNAVARALATSRTHTIGLIVPNLVNPFFAESAFALERVAFDRGYSLLVGNASEEHRHALDYAKVFADRQVDGMVVAPISGDTREILETIRRHQIPVVFTDRGNGVEGPMVLTDNTAGAKLATEHLILHGRTVHACITGPEFAAPSHERARGWQDALTAAGQVVGTDRVVFQPFTSGAGYDAMRQLIRAQPHIDSVFVGSDIQAMGVLRALHDEGLRPGTDVSVISFDGTKGTEYTYPRLTAVMQPIELVALAVIELLVQLIEDRQSDVSPTATQILPMRLVTRESCGCHPREQQVSGRVSTGQSTITHEGVR